MKKELLLLFSLILFVATYAVAQSPVGTWKTIDDETGLEKSYVEIYEQGGKLYGKILEVLQEEDKGKLCDVCPGKKKNQPVDGLEILMGMKKDGDYWSGGKILDPKNGKVYKCYIELESDDKLKVRGYIGFALLGRTQYWYRK